MRSSLTVGITVEDHYGQPGPSVQVSVPLDAQVSDDEILVAVRRCRMLAEQSLPNESPQQETTQRAASGNPKSAKRLATEKQVNAISAMAKRQGMTLDRTLHDRFGASSLSALTISEASTLIDELKGNLQSA